MVVGCVCVCWCLFLGVSRRVKVLSCHGVGAVHWIFLFTARAGLGSSWVARNNNVFIERNSLPMDHIHRYCRWMPHDILAWCHHLHFLDWDLCYTLLLRWNQYVKAWGHPG